MTAKEYLGQVYYIDREINMTLAKADKLRKSLYGKGQKFDDVGGSKSSQSSDEIGDVIATVIDYENKANALIDKLIKARIEIETAIKLVPDSIQREVLERRYLLFQPWETYFDIKTGDKIIGIDEAMHYSSRQIYRIHGKALLWVSVNVSECQL
ncbi:MAG: hypothetical protein IIT42_04505 [Clostridia bacterium]|nr:hypothetical protein [Clostridia bacterium]